VIELVAGALVLLGLGTRGSAFIASGSMAFAYFDVHQPGALWPIQNGGELPVLFCWSFLVLVFTGSGVFGPDGLFVSRSAATRGKRASKPVTT
jgi:putative oxidoreductase